MKNEVSAQNLSAVADQLLPLFFNPSNPTQVNNQAAAVIQLKNQFSKEYTVLAKANPASAEAWIKSILVFETAADLGARDEMYICSITAAPSELASSGVSAFLGFFDQSYRDHDYDVGRMKAQLFLNQPPGNLGPIRWKPAEDIRKIDSNLDGLTLDKVDRGIREQFRDRLRSRAHDILAEMGVPTALIRETIDLAFIRPQLNKLLKL